MKVLQVIPDLSPLTGGPVSALKSLAAAQAASGVATRVLTTGYGIESAPEIPGVEIEICRCRWARWRWSPDLMNYLDRHVRHYDLVAIDGLWRHTTLAAVGACRKAGVPYVIKTNGMLQRWSLEQKSWKKWPYLRWVEGAGLRGAAALHATSNMEVLSSRMQDWSAHVFVTPVAMPLLPSADRELFLLEHPQLRDRQIILFLGRLHYGKQPDVLISAFHLIHEAHPEAVLVIAGPGEPAYVRRLQALAQDLAIGPRVHFPGCLPPEIAKSACRAATVFALPSLQESFGVAIAEAMAEGVPVVVSNRVGIAPQIDKAGAGLITCPTAEATAAALSILLGDRFMRDRMGQHGRALVAQEFAAEAVAGKLKGVYVDILEGERLSDAWLLPSVPSRGALENQLALK